MFKPTAYIHMNNGRVIKFDDDDTVNGKSYTELDSTESFEKYVFSRILYGEAIINIVVMRNDPDVKKGTIYRFKAEEISYLKLVED